MENYDTYLIEEGRTYSSNRTCCLNGDVCDFRTIVCFYWDKGVYILTYKLSLYNREKRDYEEVTRLHSLEFATKQMAKLVALRLLGMAENLIDLSCDEGDDD